VVSLLAMKYFHLFVLVLLSLAFSGCEKNPFWVGESEFITFLYNHPTEGDYNWPQTHDNKSSYAFYDFTDVEEQGEDVTLSVYGVNINNLNKSFAIDTVEVLEKEDDQLREFFDKKTDLGFGMGLELSDLAVIISVDATTSMKDDSDSIKATIHKFIDWVVNHSDDSRVAVQFFGGRNDLDKSTFHTKATVEVLKAFVDNHDAQYTRTALFQHTETALEALEDLDFKGSKSLISICDGRDNDSDKPDSAVIRIQDKPLTRYSIGIKADRFKREDIRDVASRTSTMYVVDEISDLEEYLEELENPLDAAV
jgi:hypothetical protein